MSKGEFRDYQDAGKTSSGAHPISTLKWVANTAFIACSISAELEQRH